MSAIYFSVLYLNTMHRVDGRHIEGPELNTLNLVIMIFSRTSKRVVWLTVWLTTLCLFVFSVQRRVVIKNLIHRYFSGKQNTLRKEPEKNTTPSDEDTPEEEDEVQTKLMEVTKTLQSLQKAVHQFRRKTPTVRIREDELFFLKLWFNLFLKMNMNMKAMDQRTKITTVFSETVLSEVSSLEHQKALLATVMFLLLYVKWRMLCEQWFCQWKAFS